MIIRYLVSVRRHVRFRCRRCDVPFSFFRRTCPRCGAIRKNYFIYVCVLTAALAAVIPLIIEGIERFSQD
jgi:hypothetical protein